MYRIDVLILMGLNKTCCEQKNKLAIHLCCKRRSQLKLLLFSIPCLQYPERGIEIVARNAKCSEFPNYFSTVSLYWHLWQTAQYPGWGKGREKQGDRGEKAHLQMARVGVYWQEHQNTSVVSSGIQAAHCEWPDRSQELKPRSLQYNWGWRGSIRNWLQMWHYSPHTQKVINKVPLCW